MKIQGVSWNITVARGLECRLWTLILFVTISRQPTLTCTDSGNNLTTKPNCHTLNEILHISGNIESTKLGY